MSNLLERYKDADWTKAMTRKQGNYRTLVNELDKFYSGDHSPMTGSSGYLSKYFPNSYAGGKMGLVSQPLLTRLIDAAATLFHSRPGWKLLRDNVPISPEDPDAVLWQKIRKLCRLDLQCRHIQRRDVLFGTVFARPAWRDNSLHIDILKPSLVEVLENPDNPSRLDSALAISVVLDENRREIWERPNAENGWTWVYGVIDTKNETIEDPLFENTRVNGYECYPFVAFSTHPSLTSVYATVDQTAHDQQVGIDLIETWADYQFRTGFTVSVIKTSKDMGKDEVPIGGEMAVLLNPGSEESFQRVASGLDSAQLTEFIQARMKRYAALRGIDPDILSTDGKQMIAALTGVAEQMQRVDLQELRQDAAIPYEFTLDTLFSKLRSVWNWHRSDLPMDEALTVEIEWPTPTVPGNELQQAQADEIRIAQGTATPEEIRAQRAGKPVSELQKDEGMAEDTK